MEKSKKIAVIGPVTPYKGGIAQYNERLVQALRQLKGEESVVQISFRSQLPSLRKILRFKFKTTRIKDDQQSARFLLSPLSIRSWEKTITFIQQQECHLVIINWWTLAWQPSAAYLAKRLQKKGIKVLFVCHNLYDHDMMKGITWVSKILLKTHKNYLVHSKDQAQELKKLIKQPNVLVRTHPVYDHFPRARAYVKKRGKLEILYFGTIRPYKGLGVLIKALEKINTKDIYLTIAGEVWGDKERLESELHDSTVTNIGLRLEYIGDEDAAAYFKKTDVVALPYLSATGSGVVALAYYYGKPVVASSVGGLKEAVISGETGWLVTPNSVDELADTLAGITRKKTSSMKKYIEQFCEKNSWDAMAKAITEFTEDA